MGKKLESISPELAAWISEQHLFFVATAPLANDGLVNLSPKGLDSFRVIGEQQVAYLDLTGSGAETIAHLRENGRIVLMFCAFSGPPKIVRLHGQGKVITKGDEQWGQWLALYPAHRGIRSVIVVDVSRVSESCGYSVPRMEFVEDRETLVRWAEKKSDEELVQYRRTKNQKSVEGLPALRSDEA
ncbi:MAG: pyridoxamine 5'-phosphate oxidase family protein [Planctomycetes bacterium]|nr:pyridoxamine 5'-phosphate oxidase family protein [Planctomycetota bacterium]